MAKKKKDPFDEVFLLACEINKSARRWNEIRLHGSSDPAWPDGVNMNLIRNHIIYFRRRINELCNEYGIIHPDEAFCEIPPEVPNNLWLREREGPCYKRISSFYNDKGLVLLEKPLPEYVPIQEGQTTLF